MTGRLLKRGFIGLLLLLVVAVGAALIYRTVRQHQIAAAIHIDAPPGIAALEPIHLGGVEQWISLRGHERTQPLLLFLHGGPGLPEMPFAQVNAELEKHFIVVQWDQRGSGKSYHADIPVESMNLAQLLSDAEELATNLIQRFPGQPLFLVGHSSGSVIGVRLAAKRPDLIRAYIGMGQVANLQESETLLYNYAKKTAEEQHARKAVEQLAKIGNPPFANAKELQVSQKWVNHFAAQEPGVISPNRIGLMLFSPATTLFDYWRIVRGAAFSFEHLWRELFAVDLFREVPRLEVPVYFFLGRHDRVVTAEVAEKYFQKLDAPRGKKLIWFEHSAHWPQLSEPEKFQRLMIEEVLKQNSP